MKIFSKNILLILFAGTIFGCDGGGAGSVVEHEPVYEPKFMCTGDTVTAGVTLTMKMDIIQVMDNKNKVWAHEKNEKSVKVRVPNIQEDQLQFKVIIEKDMPWYTSDIKKTVYTNFKLFDNPIWVNDDGIPANQINYTAEVKSTEKQARDGDEFCLDWNPDGTCSEWSRSVGDTCYIEHEFYMKFQNAIWSFSPNQDYSNRIKASKIKNLTGYPILMSIAGEEDMTIQPGAIKEFAPVSPGDLSASMAIIGEDQEGRLCGKVTKIRSCPGTIGGEDGRVTKEDFPDPFDCYGPLPVIDMELFCEQP